MRTYKEAASFLQAGRDKTYRRLTGRASSIRLRDDGTIAVRYHKTDVVVYNPDGTVILNTDKWRTVTSKARITEYSPANVYANRNVWYVVGKKADSLFYDGMVVNADGQPVAPRSAEDEQKLDNRLNKMLKLYISGFAKEVCATAFAKPGAGDCLYCQIELDRLLNLYHQHASAVDNFRGNPNPDEDGIKNVSHILDHMHEGYHVPSLYYIACINQRLGGGPEISWTMGVVNKDRDWIIRTLKSFFHQAQTKRALIEALKTWEPGE